MKILVMGLPGSGKTYLAERLAKLLDAVHFNADRVRATISTDLGFAIEDRVEHARRLGWMCQFVKDSGHVAIADFVCPTEATRNAFDPDFIIFMNTLDESRYADTNAMFQVPKADLTIENFSYSVEDVASKLGLFRLDNAITAIAEYEKFDMKAPTAFLLGRYQPFHDGHYQLALEALRRTGQICLAVRNTTGLEKNPFSFEDVAQRIKEKFVAEGTWDPAKITIEQLPNITNIFYGRDVGYTIEKIELDEALQQVSATKIRQQLGLK